VRCLGAQPFAKPPKADMCSATRDVRFGPKADIAKRALSSVSMRLLPTGINNRMSKLLCFVFGLLGLLLEHLFLRSFQGDQLDH